MQLVTNVLLEGSNETFPQLSVFRVTLQLNSTALLNAKSYFITVRAGFHFPFHPDAYLNSSGVMARPALPGSARQGCSSTRPLSLSLGAGAGTVLRAKQPAALPGCGDGCWEAGQAVARSCAAAQRGVPSKSSSP